MNEHYSIDESIRMQQSHVPKWRAMISAIIEPKRPDEVVLDYGCNLGGFLKLLHEERGFSLGVGVDTGRNLVNTARQARGTCPIEFHEIEYDKAVFLQNSPSMFDLAFSHEVLHLVRDIHEHAELIHAVLKADGSYYAVRSFSKPEVWQRHKETLKKKGLQPFYLSPDDIVDAFESKGFDVQARLLPFNWFTPCDRKKRDEYFGLMGMLEHYSQRKVLYRFAKA
jgi:SAM-dependent methyltransferase